MADASFRAKQRRGQASARDTCRLGRHVFERGALGLTRTDPTIPGRTFAVVQCLRCNTWVPLQVIGGWIDQATRAAVGIPVAEEDDDG